MLSGRLNGVEGDEPYFGSSELSGGYWTTFSGIPQSISIHHDGAWMCFDCGKVTASMSVDVKEARKVMDKWGTEALKSRLAAGDKAG